VNNLEFVKDASSIAGSQSIVVSIDVKKNFFGKYHVYSNSGSINTKLDPVDFALRAQDAGAGEIILCSIDREGAGNGFDLSIIETISDKLSIPLVAQGGAANLEHFKDAVGVGASAVAAGDMFVFHGKHKAVLITYPEYSELEAQFNEIVKDRSCS
jgi:cyclase